MDLQMRNLLDISIVTYNSEKYLENLVQGILCQDIDLKSVSLLFHDNGSKDKTVNILKGLIGLHRGQFGSVSIHAHKDNLVFGAAHNLSAARGKGKFVFILNPDTELFPGCLNTLLNAAQSDSDHVAAWEARQAPYEHPKVYDPVSLETPWASGSVLLVRRSAFEKVGGFDPEIFLYGEDVDLSWRLQEEGWVIRYIPKAIVWHHTYQKKGEVNPRQYIGCTRANLMLRTRYGSIWDILKGLKLQAGILILPSRQFVPRQRLHVFRTIRDFALHGFAWRTYGSRTVSHRFYNWDYCRMRQGFFYDTSAGIKLLEKPADELPKVSVLIRTIGRKLLLKQALQSVANQTYPNIEVVVVEDGPATLNELIEDFNVLRISYYALGERRGRCFTGNEAMAKATGEYYLFLDEDDLFYADHIEQLISTVLKYQAKIAYSYTFEVPTKIDSNTHTVLEEGEYTEPFNRRFSFLKLMVLNYIPISAALFHRSLYETCGGFDPEVSSMEDWNLWVRYSLQYRPFESVAKTTALYRVPKDKKVRKERHKNLVKYMKIVKKKQAKLPVALQVSDLVELSSEFAEQASLEDALRKRFPSMGLIIRLLAYLYRRASGITFR